MTTVEINKIQSIYPALPVQVNSSFRLSPELQTKAERIVNKLKELIQEKKQLKTDIVRLNTELTRLSSVYSTETNIKVECLALSSLSIVTALALPCLTDDIQAKAASLLLIIFAYTINKIGSGLVAQ